MDIIEKYINDVGATYDNRLKQLITLYTGTVGEMLSFAGNDISGVPDIVFSTAHTCQPIREDYVYATYAYKTSQGKYDNPSTFSSTSYRYPNAKHISDFEDVYDQQYFYNQTHNKFIESSFGIDRSGEIDLFKIDTESETNSEGLKEFAKFATLDSSLANIISDDDKYEIQFIFYFNNKLLETSKYELEVGFKGQSLSTSDPLCEYLISNQIMSKDVLTRLIKNKNSDIYPDIVRLIFTPSLSQSNIYIFSPV